MNTMGKEVITLSSSQVKQTTIKYVMFIYSSEPTHVEMLDAVSLRFLHFNVC